MQDSAPSHRANQVQNFVKQKLTPRFVKSTYWPPKLPDCNPLDHYFWGRGQEKVYDGRYCYPLATIDELKRRIRDVWDECATDLPKSAKQWNSFSPVWKALTQKKAAQSKLFLDRHNEQKYLLNTFWLFIFYEIIVPRFSCNQMKLDRKRKFEIFFWRQHFHFSRV